MGEWRQIVQAYAQHFKDLGCTGWCWEVWNEPDNHGVFKGSDQQYCDLYAAIATGIKAADPTAKVGGAADASVLAAGARLKPLLERIKVTFNTVIRVNQKGLRQQDRPVPLASLPEDDQALIRHHHPEMLETPHNPKR